MVHPRRPTRPGLQETRSLERLHTGAAHDAIRQRVHVVALVQFLPGVLLHVLRDTRGDSFARLVCLNVPSIISPTMVVTCLSVLCTLCFVFVITTLGYNKQRTKFKAQSSIHVGIPIFFKSSLNRSSFRMKPQMGSSL